jgi:hypothetical protein
MIKKVISGGQTGADHIGLEVAREVGIETGGTAPRGFRTESGPDLSLVDFGLVEDDSPYYNGRTLRNILDAEATILFGDMDSPGSRSTILMCKKNSKPYLCNPESPELIRFIQQNNFSVLNIAGNRASKLTLTQMEDIRKVLRETFITLKDDECQKETETCP